MKEHSLDASHNVRKEDKTASFYTSSRPVAVRLKAFVGTAIIVPFPSGAIYINQCGVMACLQKEMGGILIPVANDMSLTNLLLSPEVNLHAYFSKFSSGTFLCSADADVIDDILETHNLFPAISVDCTRLNDSHEAWVNVSLGIDFDRISGSDNITAKEGVLIWGNSD